MYPGTVYLYCRCTSTNETKTQSEKKYKSDKTYFAIYTLKGLSRESGKEDQSAARLLLRTHSAGPASQTCYYL
jgi:hypothetical protein